MAIERPSMVTDKWRIRYGWNRARVQVVVIHVQTSNPHLTQRLNGLLVIYEGLPSSRTTLGRS